MKKLIFTLVILLVFASSYAQTEKIALRSHSGKDKTFKITGNDNWGVTPAMQDAIRKRDSALKARADSIARKAVIDSMAMKPVADSSKQTKVYRKPKYKHTVKYKNPSHNN